MIKVLIVDDQELIRESLKVVLNVSLDIEVADAVPSVAEALKSAAHCRPDVVLMDIRMPGMDGVEGTKLMLERCPQAKVIILTTFDDDEYVFGALKNGASGYLLKGSSVSELAEAIRIAYNGGAMINPNIASKVLHQFSSMARSSARIQVDEALTADISKSEWQVIRTVGSGMSNKEIAKELCLSEGTVRNTLSNILCKLNLRDRTQLAIWAVQTGAVNGGPV
ncbi:MAG: response regulator transcription factor [Oscillibacter sp.]|jgi:DNA-binding NarL/FixJ family response regulator|nr:response regulator transcription factor [Oscillibacter sp.]